MDEQTTIFSDLDGTNNNKKRRKATTLKTKTRKKHEAKVNRKKQISKSSPGSAPLPWMEH